MIRDAIKWRIDFIRQQRWKLYWNIRALFDLSKKQRINGVSVIVVGRNDNYGGDFSKRLEATLDWNMTHLPNPELIYVEWNQIKERPSDCEWISKKYPQSKCYIVPNDIHNTICTNPKMPMMEYFAKNIGIRKAHNDWILLINADCFIGYDVIKNIQKLNTQSVYGTHYISIKWDTMPISEDHLKNKKIISVAFSADKNISSVAGNFILTHKKNWEKATGYDERLTDVRAGVDSNGLEQLLHMGLKPKVIGHHYHLDHPESIILGGANATHGKSELLKNNIPYTNMDNWGLVDYPLEQKGERIWQLLKI